MPHPPTPTRLDAEIDLLLQVERLLAEADRMRAVRDRLIEVVRATPPPTADRKAVRNA
jgi:hypothetical protein